MQSFLVIIAAARSTAGRSSSARSPSTTGPVDGAVDATSALVDFFGLRRGS